MTTKPIDGMKFEEAFEELEAIVEKLETDMPSLEESINLFERGQALSKHCATLLEEAELKVSELSDGGLID